MTFSYKFSRVLICRAYLCGLQNQSLSKTIKTTTDHTFGVLKVTKYYLKKITNDIIIIHMCGLISNLAYNR